MHRWVWDLHYAAPRSLQRGFPISAVPGDTPQEPLGPVASPGIYEVRLSIGTRQWLAPLNVRPDPRVQMSAQDYAALFTTTHELADAFDASSAALLACKSLRAQLEKLDPKDNSPLSARLHLLDTHIGALLDSPADLQPARRGLERLNGDAAALYEQVNGVDALPTAVQIEESRRAGADWRDLESRWRQLRDVELPQTNLALAKARLPALVPNTDPPRDLDFADEE
jgi:hypothetical protein